MNLEIDIECRRCGLFFRQNLCEMPHGVALKCPFCFGTGLAVRGDLLTEKHGDKEVFDLSFRERLLERKIKL